MPESHTVSVADGRTLAAVHHEPTDGDGGERGTGDWFVCCHGLVSDKSGSYERRCERAASEGYDAVRFDARGCGESDGAFAESTLSARVADLRAVLEHFEPPSYVLFGSSFGAAVALHGAVDDDRLVALVARAPVTDTGTFEAYRDVLESAGELRIDDEHVLDQRFVDNLETYDFAAVLGSWSDPVAIFHGADDATVPFADSLAATRRLDGDVRLEKYAGEDHRFSAAAEDRLLDATFAWLTAIGGDAS